MKTFLNSIRNPNYNTSISRQTLNTFFVLFLGLILGFVSKYLDCTASNELPYLIEVLDLRNCFSRLAIWLLLAVVISVYSKTSIRASINTFLFFVGMLVSYYTYTKFMAGFFPKSYILIWVGLTSISPILAFICWYAKGTGKIALLISATILGILFIQAFSFGIFYFDVSYPLEAVVWLIGIAILYKSPKQLVAMLGAAIIIALILNPIMPFHY